MNKYIVSSVLITLLLTATGFCAAAEAPILFDGKTLDNWMLENGDPVTKGWEVVDGVIHLNRKEGKAGHIVSKHDYENFTLSFEWKIVKGGNSGLKYRVRKYGNSMLGCEYQILGKTGLEDNKTKPKNSTGSLYDIYEPNKKTKLNPTGEYNHARIEVKGNSIQHWLNGELIVSATVGDDEWKRRIADSKFKKNKGFGENRLGKIMLTDHGAEVWYKNLKLTPLPSGKDK